MTITIQYTIQIHADQKPITLQPAARSDNAAIRAAANVLLASSNALSSACVYRPDGSFVAVLHYHNTGLANTRLLQINGQKYDPAQSLTKAFPG